MRCDLTAKFRADTPSATSNHHCLPCDEHEYLSGILLAFAMIKPQDTVIVCLVFLMMKKFKPLIVAAVIDVSAWFAVSVLTRKGMLELLRLFLFSPHRNESASFSGIFTLAFEPMTAIAASMLFGIIFVPSLYALFQRMRERISRRQAPVSAGKEKRE